MRQFILLFGLTIGFLLQTACGEEKDPPIVIGPGDGDSDSDSDTDSDSDADADPDNAYVGKTCDIANAATDCGTGLYCVDGVCCKDQCTGECGSCAVPGFEGHCTALDAGTVCRAAATACDEEEICDGSAKVCPADGAKPLGAACGDEVDNDCDNPDTCDINSICQPNYAPAGGACTDPSGYCKVNPVCDGAGLCTSQVNKTDGEACGNTAVTECDTPDSCLAGVCEPNYLQQGTPCGDKETKTLCNFPDSCDGSGVCLDNILAAGTACGDTDETECNKPDACDTDGTCNPMLMPDETACGDATNGECNKPDSCLSGICEANIIPDGTVCNDGESSVVFRCNDTDCSATPQQQVVGWSCSIGECTEVITPEWEDVGLPCTVSQVCAASETGAACEECNVQQPNVCVGKVATGYYPDGFCAIVDGAAQCVYDAMEDDCSKDTEGNTNCVEGICSSYSCATGEKDYSYEWTDDDEGWELGNWVSDGEWPWHSSAGKPALKLPAVDLTEVADTYLLSPELEFYACTSGTVSFNWTMKDEWTSCSPKLQPTLECGFGDDWEVLWSEEELLNANASPIEKSEDTLVEVDLAPCIGKTHIQFRFSLQNYCAGSIDFMLVDDFKVTAVQDATTDTTPLDTDTGSDTTPDTATDATPDTAPDTTPDTAPDTTPDTAPDTTPDTTSQPHDTADTDSAA